MHTRMIKPEFFTDEDLGQLEPILRLFYVGLWCSADKEGRLEDRPIKLKTEIMPYDKIDPEAFLKELSKPKKINNDRAFILRYKVNGERYIQIIQFIKNQSIHHTEKPSRIPPPPNFSMLDNGEITVNEPLDNGELTEELDTIELDTTKKNINELYDFCIETLPIKPTKKTATRANQIKIRLSQYSLDEIKLAIQTMKNDKWLMGENPNSKVYLTFDYVFKRQDNISKFLDIAKSVKNIQQSIKPKSDFKLDYIPPDQRESPEVLNNVLSGLTKKV